VRVFVIQSNTEIPQSLNLVAKGPEDTKRHGKRILPLLDTLLAKLLNGFRDAGAHKLIFLRFDIVEHTHAAAAKFFDNAVVRDGLVAHWRESYVCETGKSMKAMELAVCQKDCWRNIAISLIDTKKGEQTAQSCANAWFQQLRSSELTCPVFGDLI
jgi:hypothetical protein